METLKINYTCNPKDYWTLIHNAIEAELKISRQQVKMFCVVVLGGGTMPQACEHAKVGLLQAARIHEEFDLLMKGE